MTKDIPQLMDSKELKTLLRVSPNTLKRLIREKSLPALRIGRQVRYDREQVQEWLMKQEIKNPVGANDEK